jgi:hypothetical protein
MEVWVLVRQEGLRLPTILLVTSDSELAHTRFDEERGNLHRQGADECLIEHILSLSRHLVVGGTNEQAGA